MATVITEIANGIYSFDHQVAEGKNAVVIGQRGAWAIDTGTYEHEGQEMVDFIREQGYAPDRLIYTHGHGDHVLGSAPFAGAEIVVAHDLMPVECRRLLPGLTRRAGVSDHEMAARIVWPTITFNDELTIDLGDRRLRLFPTPGHSQDGVSVLVEEEKLLIAGDAVVTGIVPAIGNGDSRVLESSLQKLLTMEIDVMLPGHGSPVFGRDQVQDWLRWLAGYLSSVRIFVQGALDSGLDADAVVEMVGYDQFVGDRLPKDRHNMPGRHRDTVQKIVEEELSHR